MRFSSHSGRVWAIVILDEAGLLPDFIKSWLCWMGDSYRLYLWDTSILQQKHLTALERASTEFTALFGKNRMTLPDVVPVDNTMDSFLFCMPAIHSGAVILKTNLHLVYVLLFVVLWPQRSVHAIVEVLPCSQNFWSRKLTIFGPHIAW